MIVSPLNPEFIDFLRMLSNIPPKTYGTSARAKKNAWRKRTRRYRINCMKGGVR